MSFQTYPVPASSLSSALKRKGDRGAGPGRPLYPVSADRRKSKVWQYYTQLSESHVECNVCKKQLSFHNSTTTMREHLVRKHSIRDSPPQHHPAPPPQVKEEAQETQLSGEDSSSKRARIPDTATASTNTAPPPPPPPLPLGPPQDSGKRAGLLSELILEMLFRDLHPVSVVEERGFKLLLRCLEPSFRAPPRSHLSGMLWHRHSVQRQLLQGYLRAGVGCGGAAVLCTDHWGATESGGGYLTVSVLFVDRDWRQARCVLETRPAPEPQGLRDALGGALAQFGLPESAVLGVVLDRPGPSLPLRSPGGLAGWQGLPCAALWLGECVAEALSLDPVQEALAAARVIVTHFQQDPGRAALLNPDEAGAGGSSSKARLPPPDQPARWVTTLAMCEGLLELRWVVSSVLEVGGSPPVPNLADHQWRLLQELLPALRTVRLAASFLSEEPNTPVSALLPCLHGAARLLGSQLGECGLQEARSAIGRMRGAMQKRWRIGEGEGEEEEEEEEEMLLDSPLVLSSFLDPRFKELRFLSPDARSRLHGRVKELLSAQREEGEEEAGEGEGAGGGGGGGESSPMSCVSAEGHDLQAGGEGCRISMVVVGAHGNSQWSPPPPPPPQSVYDVLLGEDPTERMPAIQQQLENYIAEPLCKRSCSPLDWWRGKQSRFPALAGLARRYLAFPSTAVPPERAFAPQESPALRRRATLAPEHLDQILFLNQNCDFIEGLRGGATGAAEHRGGQAHARETLYQSLVSFESQAWLSEDRE